MDYELVKEDLGMETTSMSYVYYARVVFNDNGKAVQIDFKYSIGEREIRDMLPPGGYLNPQNKVIVARNLFLHKLQRAWAMAKEKGPNGTFNATKPLLVVPPSS